MTDLAITAANVVKGSTASVDEGTAGVAVTAGQTLYLDSGTNTLKLSDADSGTAAARSVVGIALHAAAAGQPLKYLTGGPLTLGATLTQGVGYYLSKTAGGICPVADLTTGAYPVFLGFATSAAVINVDIVAAGVPL